MRIFPDKLESQLNRGLLPIYIISGDEPLQVMECSDLVRHGAKKQGFTEREVFTADSEFDWNSLAAASDSFSLFSERRLLELRLPTGKPGRIGGQVLRDYAARPAEDSVLLIISPKLDKSATASAWYKALDKAGASLQIWPIATPELPKWIEQRMRRAGLNPSYDAARLIAERVEGNMLAAQQEIDKLCLINDKGDIDVKTVAASVANSSRFTIYDFSDACLAGDANRLVKVFNRLGEEGVEPVLLLWALTRDVRTLASLAYKVASGKTLSMAMNEERIWKNRQNLMQRALSRHNVSQWGAFLNECAVLDRLVKGSQEGDITVSLIDLGLSISKVTKS